MTGITFIPEENQYQAKINGVEIGYFDSGTEAAIVRESHVYHMYDSRVLRSMPEPERTALLNFSLSAYQKLALMLIFEPEKLELINLNDI